MEKWYRNIWQAIAKEQADRVYGETIPRVSNAVIWRHDREDWNFYGHSQKPMGLHAKVYLTFNLQRK